MANRKLTRAAIDAGVAALRYLRTRPTGARFRDIVKAVGKEGAKNSEPTVRRGLDWLRDIRDAPLVYDAAAGTWTLSDPDFTLPLLDPSEADLTAAIFATAVLGPMSTESVRKRLENLVAELDALLRVRDHEAAPMRRNAVTASISTGTEISPKLLAKLAGACSRGQVLSLEYYSPWQDAARHYVVEPWQLRVHDGTMYLRAFSRGPGCARSFRVAQVQHARVMQGDEPRESRPRADRLWGPGPAFGVDDDRPDIARVRMTGAFARWVERDRWHPEQVDVWDAQRTTLTRTLPYASCRELARRLLALGDALVSVEPPALRDELARHAAALVESTRAKG